MSLIEELSYLDVCRRRRLRRRRTLALNKKCSWSRPLLSLFLSLSLVFLWRLFSHSLSFAHSRSSHFDFLSFFLLFSIYRSLSHSWLSSGPRKNAAPSYIYSRPSQAFAPFFLSLSLPLSLLSIPVHASQNSCVQTSVIGCNLTASSDHEKDGDVDGEKEERQEKTFLFCSAFFCYKITSRVSFITWGYVVYAVHDNDVKSAQKISRGCHRLCVRYRMNEKLPAIDHTCLMKCSSLEKRNKTKKKRIERVSHLWMRQRLRC